MRFFRRPEKGKWLPENVPAIPARCTCLNGFGNYSIGIEQYGHQVQRHAQIDECAAFFAGHDVFCVCIFGGQGVFGFADGAGYGSYVGCAAVTQIDFDNFSALVVVQKRCQIVSENLVCRLLERQFGACKIFAEAVADFVAMLLNADLFAVVELAIKQGVFVDGCGKGSTGQE